MTGFDDLFPRDPQFGAADIRRLFDLLSAHLRDADSTGHHLMIVGGAALALMWDDRTMPTAPTPQPAQPSISLTVPCQPRSERPAVARNHQAAAALGRKGIFDGGGR